jgi:hypothetical protein
LHPGSQEEEELGDLQIHDIIIAVVLVALLVVAHKSGWLSKIQGFVGDKFTENKCIDCKRKTHEFIWEGSHRIPLCREHLIEHFREHFINARQKMIVTYPDFEEINGSYYQYSYETIESFAKASPDKKINNLNLSRMNEWLAMIDGKCAKCSRDASVAYFPRFSVPWEHVPGFWTLSKSPFPIIHKVTDKPVILCKACAFKEIEGSFRPSGNGFHYGVFTPEGDEEGIYITGKTPSSNG